MFNWKFCACLWLLVASMAAPGADGETLKPASWGGSYRNDQVTLQLKAKPSGEYEGTILFEGQRFPLSASGDAGKLTGTFQTDDGSFDFTAARDGDSVNLSSGGKIYQLKRQAANPLGGKSPATNPLAAPTDSPAQGVTGNSSGGVPKGYSVVITTDSGKKLLTHKTEAKSVEAALGSSLQDLSGWFDARPATKGAFVDAKERRQGGAPFTAKLKGQPVKGLVSCALGENGADITVTYSRADAPASEWAKLSGGTNAPAGPATGGIKMHEYAFPDGTGSIQLPDGWKTSAQTCIHGVQIQGPAGQTVSLGVSYSVNTPDSFIVQNQIQLAAQARQMGFPPPKPIEMLVAPYTGPVEALKNLLPQLSKMSQTRGGPAVTLDKILETPKPAQAVFPNGQAAAVYFAFTKTTGGTPTPFRSRSQFETWMVGTGAWSLYITEAAAPDATFDKDWPVMLAIATSLKTDPVAVQRATGRAIDAQNANFRAMQKAHATQVAGFDDYMKSQQRNSLIRDRVATDFDEVIRGQRTVEDTRTGERTSVDLGNVNEIVDKLNERDPDRYIQIPLRDELYPLPTQPNR
ncbi:MAG: hypothetical protein NT154_41310 [Verrucomicrobia bacterium]|nr:hypothetical protein [Verrucomicrobiota bacterium]